MITFGIFYTKIDYEAIINFYIIKANHISVFLLYLDFEITSGLIQNGVPMTVSLSARVCFIKFFKN